MDGDRREDWNNSVEKRLVDLNSAQLSSDTEQAKLRRKLDRHDLMLRGDPINNKKGLIEQANHLENEINKFNQIFNKDYLNHGGLISFITYVYNREKEREEAKKESRGYKWAFWTVVVGAVIGLAGLVITNKEQIEKWWAQPKLAPLEQEIERSKHPRGKKIIRVRVIQEDAGDKGD